MSGVGKVSDIYKLGSYSGSAEMGNLVHFTTVPVHLDKIKMQQKDYLRKFKCNRSYESALFLVILQNCKDNIRFFFLFRCCKIEVKYLLLTLFF
jgi:hypothetical protein